MPEKANISRTLLLPFMSIILLVCCLHDSQCTSAIKGQMAKAAKKDEDVQ